jgi:hypothetical protein
MMDDVVLARLSVSQIFDMADLLPIERDILYLSLGEERTFVEIADLIGPKYYYRDGLTEGTIRYRAKQALQKIADLRLEE